MSSAEGRFRELMLRGLAGDAQAQGNLLSELAVLLRKFHRRRLGDGPDVEDLVQETLIAVHTKRATYDCSQPFTAWAYAIARYKLIDHLRRLRPHATVPWEDCEELFTHSEPERDMVARDLQRLLAELPERQRRAIQLTRIEGLSVEEAAIRSGQTVAALKVGVHRGLKRLIALQRRG